jgi:hypothetical protein
MKDTIGIQYPIHISKDILSTYGDEGKHGAIVAFKKVVITEGQTAEINLPVRSTKPKGPRSKIWMVKPRVELDALPAPILRYLVKESIEMHIDQEAWGKLVDQRNTLDRISKNLVHGKIQVMHRN